MARKAGGGTEAVRVGLLGRSGAGACPNLLQRRPGPGSAAKEIAEYQRFSSPAPARSGPLQQIWTNGAAAGIREGRSRVGRRPWRAHQRSRGPRRRSIGRRSHGPAGPSTPRTPRESPPHQETHPHLGLARRRRGGAVRDGEPAGAPLAGGGGPGARAHADGPPGAAGRRRARRIGPGAAHRRRSLEVEEDRPVSAARRIGGGRSPCYAEEAHIPGEPLDAHIRSEAL